MLKKCLLFFTFLLTLLFVNGQSSKIDSLKQSLKNTGDIPLKVELLTAIADTYGREGLDSNLYYRKIALEISEENNLETRHSLASKVIRLAAAKNDLVEVIKFGRPYFELFEIEKSKHEKLVIADDLSYAYIATGEVDSFHYYNSFIIHNVDLKNEKEKSLLVSALRKRASSFVIESKYDLAILDLKEAIQYIDTSDYFSVYTVYVTLADVYTQFGDYDKGLENFNIANKFASKIDLLNPKIHILYSFTDFYLRFEEYNKALKYALKGLDLATKNENTYGILVFKSILAKSYINLEEFSKAKTLLEEVVVLGAQFQSEEIIAIAKYDLGGVAISNNDFALALKYCEESWSFFEPTNSFLHKVKVCDCISKANEGLKNYSASLAYFKKARIFEDSTNSEEQIKNTYKLQNEFELEKKEALYKAEQEKVELVAQQKLKTKNQFIVGVIILAFIILGLVFSVLKNIQRKKERRYLIEKEQSQAKFSQELIQFQEDERKRISRELHDSVGQDLILMKTKASSSENQEFGTLIVSTLNNVRHITQNLHPFVLENFGLTAALNKLMKAVDDGTELFVSNEIENLDGKLNKDQELNIYRMVQEALNNVIKHSKSPSVLIAARIQTEFIDIKIQDYGIGFNQSEKNKIMKSLGMKTLEERAKILEAQLVISSRINNGTTIHLKIPTQNV